MTMFPIVQQEYTHLEMCQKWTHTVFLSQPDIQNCTTTAFGRTLTLATLYTLCNNYFTLVTNMDIATVEPSLRTPLK